MYRPEVKARWGVQMDSVQALRGAEVNFKAFETFYSPRSVASALDISLFIGLGFLSFAPFGWGSSEANSKTAGAVRKKKISRCQA